MCALTHINTWLHRARVPRPARGQLTAHSAQLTAHSSQQLTVTLQRDHVTHGPQTEVETCAQVSGECCFDGCPGHIYRMLSFTKTIRNKFCGHNCAGRGINHALTAILLAHKPFARTESSQSDFSLSRPVVKSSRLGHESLSALSHTQCRSFSERGQSGSAK